MKIINIYPNYGITNESIKYLFKTNTKRICSQLNTINVLRIIELNFFMLFIRDVQEVQRVFQNTASVLSKIITSFPVFNEYQSINIVKVWMKNILHLELSHVLTIPFWR